jgi:transposase-like protein
LFWIPSLVFFNERTALARNGFVLQLSNMPSKKATKRKRYTIEEKRQIVGFVNQVNAEKGRGGVAAASKKFGVNALTVSTWLKSGLEEVVDTGRTPIRKGEEGRGKILDQLASLDRVIAAKRKELTALEASFQKLKAKL